MSTIVALGETHELQGFALAGVTVVAVTAEAELSAAWQQLGPDVALVILSPLAARVLESDLAKRPDVLTAVMP